MPATPQELNRYAYALNNPLKYTDPTGHWIESAIDIAFIAYDLYDISQNGLTWTSGLALTADVGGLLLPGLTGGGMLVRAATHADEAAGALHAMAHADEAAGAAQAEVRGGAGVASAETAGAAEQILTEGVVYRGGSDTIKNLTPRPGIDTTGLSAFRSLEQAVPPGGKAQVIDVARLKNLVAYADDVPPGHVSIRPRDVSELAQWAATRDSSIPHPYTQELRDAIIDVVRRPK